MSFRSASETVHSSQTFRLTTSLGKSVPANPIARKPVFA